MKQNLLRLTLRAFGQLPLPVLHTLGAGLGHLLWWLPNRWRSVTRQQLEICLPEVDARARARIARRSLVESAKAVCEAPAIWFGSWRRLRRWLDDEPARRELRAAAAGPRGLILLTPHLGAWELAGQFAASVGPITILYKPQKGPFEALIRQGRARQPNARPVPTDAGGVRALLAALRRGEMIGVLPDHDPPAGSGQFADFFGVPAHTMELVGKLAARSGASVWFLLALRQPWARGYRFSLLRAPTGIDELATAATALNRGVEACVMQAPEQYWWSYPRFRRRPPGETPLSRRPRPP